MSCRGMERLGCTPAAATWWRRPAPPPASGGSAAELERGRRRGRFCWPNCCRRRAGGQEDAQSRSGRGGARRGGPAPMRRKEKRLLQAVALALAALVLLPNVGLWALYRERQPDGSPGGSGVAVAPAVVQVSGLRSWVGSTLSLISLPACSSLLHLPCVSAPKQSFPFWGWEHRGSGKVKDLSRLLLQPKTVFSPGPFS